MDDLRNPANLKKETPLTPKQFHWCFTNALSREESDAVYQRYYIPGSARPFFQAGFGNFNPKAATKIDYRNPARRCSSSPVPKTASSEPRSFAGQYALGNL